MTTVKCDICNTEIKHSDKVILSEEYISDESKEICYECNDKLVELLMMINNEHKFDRIKRIKERIIRLRFYGK